MFDVRDSENITPSASVLSDVDRKFDYSSDNDVFLTHRIEIAKTSTHREQINLSHIPICMLNSNSITSCRSILRLVHHEHVLD